MNSLQRKRLSSAVLAALFFAIALLSSCRAGNDADSLGNAIVIDGVDVSGMTIEQARTELASRHEAMLADIVYTIKGSEKTLELAASELGMRFNTEETLMQAASLSKENPANNAPRELSATLSLDEEEAREKIAGLAKRLAAEPVEATAEYTGGEFVFREGAVGKELDESAFLEELRKSGAEAGNRTLTAPMRDGGQPTAGVEALKNDNALISEFITFFDKDPYNAENRVANVVKAAELVDGIVLKAGESFDTNAILGDRNEKNGWSKAPGIRNGKYEMEYGGGVCQVSTTLYNAALMAGFEIDERSPHSWPVGYVPIGMDATISTGGPNLVFTNTTELPVTISAIIDREHCSLTVRVFGRRSGEFEAAKIVSEQTGTIPVPNTEVVVDNSLTSGEQVTDRKAREGKTSVTYRVLYDDQGGEIRRELVSKDTYRAIAARVLVGA